LFINVIPARSTSADRIICFFSIIPQYTKNMEFNIKNNGRISVRTESRGNNLGARNGNTYAVIVNTVSTMLRKNMNLLNHESFFIYIYLPARNKNSFSSAVRLS